MSMRAWLILARPRQWSKNLLLYAAFLFTAGEAWTLVDVGSWAPLLARATIAFAIFCVLSAGGYFVNDAADVLADRSHPRKRLRPVASGEVGPASARRAGLVLLAAGAGLSWLLGPWFAMAAAWYAVLTLSYSAWLKHVPMLDVFVVGALFALRAVAGAGAIGVDASVWLAVCTFAAAVYVSSVKRSQEARLLGPEASGHRPVLGGIRRIEVLMWASGAGTVALYLAYAVTAPNLPKGHWMLVTVPLVAYGLFRYRQASLVAPERDAEELVLRDPALVVTVAAFLALALTVLLAGER